MAREPWFKFFAADYLLDPAVDALPLEAQAVLVRVWCICHIEGTCPTDCEEIARKTRLLVEVVTKYFDYLAPFFEVREGRLHSRRMEEEKRRSEIARRGGRVRGQQLRSADGSAECSTQSQSQRQNPPPLVAGFDLSVQQKCTQIDFDQRDLRRYSEERRKLDLILSAGGQTDLTDQELFELICIRAGVTPAHMESVLARVGSAKPCPSSPD